MKKSSTVTLALIGAAGLLTACTAEAEIQSGVYTSVEQCMADAAVMRTKEECEGSYKAAVEDHVKNAPAFTTVKECEEEFGDGKCQPAPTVAANANPAPNQSSSSSQQSSGTSMFIPFMFGYMLGQNSHALPDNRGYSTPLRPQAVYRTRNGDGFYNAGGGFVSKTTGKVSVSPRGEAATYTAPASRTTTVGRGGFGSRVSVSS